MQSASSVTSSSATNVTTMDVAELRNFVQSQAETIAALRHQVEWFRRQIFGQKSERFVPDAGSGQLALSEEITEATADRTQSEPSKVITAHTRRAAKRDADTELGDELPFFDESKVPVQTIVLVPDSIEGSSADQYEVISEKITYRVAQRPGSYQVIKYVRRTVKLKATAEIQTVPAPE